LLSAAAKTDYEYATKSENLFHELYRERLGLLAGPSRLGNST
jgi:hypothetical protein